MIQWNLIGDCDYPLGRPIPETIEIAEMEKENPPSGDAVGTGDAIVLPNGYILLAHKRYHSSLPGRNKERKYESGEPTEIRRSRDGQTWEFLGAVEPEPAHDMTQCLVHPDGAPDEFVRIFIERAGRFITYCSYDAGETWQERRLIFDYCDPEERVHLSHPFNGLKKLSDGTILIPLQRCGRGTFYPPVLLRCLPQSDPTQMGASPEDWETIEVGHDLPESFTRGPAAIISESDVIDRPDGSLLWIMRSSCGWMFLSESHDNGTTWSRLHRDKTFGCTNSKHHLLKLSDGTILMSHHNANNTQRHPHHKRSPLAVAISRDGGFTWDRSISVAWKSDWHYGYPKGLELPNGDILYFSRYGENHDARSVGITRVKRDFLCSAQVSQDADGGHFENGIFYITGSDARLTVPNRKELRYPVQTELEFIIDELSGRFQMLSILGEGTMEMIALGVNGVENEMQLEIYDFDPVTCSVGWRSLGVSLNRGEVYCLRLILTDPWTYRIEFDDQVISGHTIKPLIPYTSQIGSSLTIDDEMRKTSISARILHWDMMSYQDRCDAGLIWDEARPCYRFITTHFAYDENGPFHGSVPRVGTDLSIPQGHWGNMDTRNPVMMGTNLAKGDGVLIVDKPFRGADGTVAFWGLPMTAEDSTEVLLGCGDFCIGLIGGYGIRPFFRINEQIVIGDELARESGLYSWQWSFGKERIEADFIHVTQEGEVINAGKGFMKKLPWQESLPRWFNDVDGGSPFRVRLMTLGVWQRRLCRDELRQLQRY